MHLPTAEPHQEAGQTGTGDALSAAFLFGRRSGWPKGECLTWGDAGGALTTARSGGSGAFTHRDEIEAFSRSREGA